MSDNASWMNICGLLYGIPRGLSFENTAEDYNARFFNSVFAER